METVINVDDYIGESTASIEPWIFIHGNLNVARALADTLEPASIEPWIFIHGNDHLTLTTVQINHASIEPWIFIHGNGTREEAIIPEKSASIEPWIFIHGNLFLHIHETQGLDLASIEPWIFIHGNRVHSRQTYTYRHCFNRAMNFHSWKR